MVSSEPLRPLTNLSYNFAANRHSSRFWPRLALPGGVLRLPSKPGVVAAATVIGAGAVVAAATWLLWPESSAPSAPPPATADRTAELRALVPAGFGDSCQSESTTPPLIEQLSCTTNSAPSEPATARFMLAQDGANLQALLRENLSGAQVVVCPGNIASPGP